MAQNKNSRSDRELSKFVESQTRAGESAVDVIVGNSTANAIPVTLDPAQNPAIYNLSVTANVQTSQAMTDGTKKILIKPRDAATIKLSYDSGFSTFVTVPRGSAYELSGIKSSSLTIYLECDKTTVIEIEEWT